jgi:hypothetical protein
MATIIPFPSSSRQHESQKTKAAHDRVVDILRSAIPDTKNDALDRLEVAIKRLENLAREGG